MKKTKLFSLNFFLLTFFYAVSSVGLISTINAQDCGSDEYHSNLMKIDKKYKKQQNKLEKFISKTQKKTDFTKMNEENYSVPIVFHIIHKGEPEGEGTNPSDSKIYEALEGLNASFSNENELGVDVGIQFCLATFDPDGNPSTGITRHDGSSFDDFLEEGMTFGSAGNRYALKDMSRWAEPDYINVYIVHRISFSSTSSVIGLYTGSSGNIYDGVIIDDFYLNSNNLLAHEVGHYFGLAHTFNGDKSHPDCINNPNPFLCCPLNEDCQVDGDRICDTPPHKRNECGEVICSDEGVVENSTKNIMSYCTQKDRYTLGQKDRMRSVLVSPARVSLLSSTGCGMPVSPGDCVEALNGYTALGQFNSSTYFLSNESVQPAAAQLAAQQNGGHLAVISSQLENGEPLFFNNISPCNFCNENSDDQDYVIMSPWDGTWSFSSMWNSRPYIIEIPCDGGGGGNGIEVSNCPSDITVEGLEVNNYSEMVTWNIPVATTDCSDGGLQITQIEGMPPGSTFDSSPSGHSIVYQIIDACGNEKTCTFFIFVEPEDSQNNCPDDILGFTSIGEFGDSKYFLSNDDAQPAAAQNIAQQNGGYLAVISSQAENDFLQQNISEMTFIGLNDVDSEGNLVWGNGEPLNYNNINPCSFCNENSESLDYVIMAPWDGAWSFSSLWNSRKYIVEIPCDDTSPMPIEFCGYLNNYLISSAESYRNYSLEETVAGLVLQTSTQEDIGANNNFIFESTTINNDGEATSTTSLILPVNNKSKFGDFGYGIEEITPTQFKFSAVNSSNVNIWENTITLNTSDNDIDELVGIEIKEMENHLIVAGSYHFGGATTPTWRPFLIKLDLDGNEIWQNLQEVVTDFPRIFVYGSTSSGGHYLNLDNVNDYKNYVIKTDEFGNQIWNTLVTSVSSIEETTFGGESPDGSGLILSVHSELGNGAKIEKFNINTGVEIWTVNLSSFLPGGQGTVGKTINGVIPTSDGGAVFIAKFLSYQLATNIYIYGRLDADGNELWHYKIPDELRDHHATLETSDGGLVFSKYNAESHTVDLFKTNGDGLFDPVCDVDIFSDLSMSNLVGWGGPELSIGSTASVDFKIHNNALADAENYVIKAYLSTDNLLSANDVLITASGISSTTFGVHETTIGFQIPSVPEAEYRLILEIDGNQTIAETNEDNNILAFSSFRKIVGGPLLELPDLRPGFFSVGGNFGLESPPGNYTYNFDLRNIGNIPSNGGTAKVFLSHDTEWSSDDILIGEKIIGNVPLGSSGLPAEPIDVTITNDIPLGLYRVLLVIDANDDILEFDELNNISTSGITVVSDSNCPTDLPDFDFLGTFENSNYFLSHDVAQPLVAQTIAESNGGYLATIKSAIENDFLASQINEMVYIGLNDFDMEGSLTYFSGETVSWVNFDVCNFCNENSSEMDFVVMHNWNGGWSWSNFYNSRKYIVEIPCGSTLTDPNINSLVIGQNSIEEKTEKLFLQNVHPNPAANKIFTTIQSPKNQGIEIQIFDARGSMKFVQTTNLLEGKNVVEISIADLTSGVYSIFIPQGEGEWGAKRFIKVR